MALAERRDDSDSIHREPGGFEVRPKIAFSLCHPGHFQHALVRRIVRLTSLRSELPMAAWKPLSPFGTWMLNETSSVLSTMILDPAAHPAVPSIM